jgi:rhamnose transport system substrate-binding protein
MMLNRKNKGRTGRLGSMVAITAVAALALTACNSGSASSTDTSSPSAGGGDQKITFIPKQLNNPYTDVVLGGGKKGATEAGFASSQVVGPLEASASSQVSFINAETQAGTNVIAIAANDPDAVCTALGEARSAGAKIVAFDSDTNPDCRDIFISQVVAKDVALIQTKLISEQIGGSGEIAILSATANATNQNAWIELMKKELQKPEYAKLKLVATVYGDDNAQKSQQEVQALLQAHPTLKGIISPTTVGVAAAAQYLSGSEYKGKVQLTGLGFPSQLKEFVKNGTMKAFALWDVEKLGYLAAYAGAALASGQISGAEGQTFKAGTLGEFKVGPDSTVLLGDPTVFTAENVDQYNF